MSVLLRAYAAAAAGLFLVSPAFSAADDCARISDNSLRLACYDALFRETKSSSTSSAWVVQEETSKVSDVKNFFVAVDSLEPLAARFGRKNKASMVIACREKLTLVYIVFGGHFTSSLNHGAVTYRVDKRPAAKKKFVNSNDHQALGLWSSSSAISFIRELIDGSTLYVQATPHSESPVEAEFPIAGLADALKPLKEACKWEAGKKAPAEPRPSR